jgi:hypothetical protein
VNCVALVVEYQDSTPCSCLHCRNIKDSLYDNEVYECFRTTLSRTKKAVRVGATSEAKSAVEEFEAMMERIHSAANGEEVQGEGAAGALDMGDVRVALEALDDTEDADAAGAWPLLLLLLCCTALLIR